MNRWPRVPGTLVLLGLFFFLGGMGASARAGGGAGKLVVEMTGFRNDKGSALARLYSSEDGYPKDGAKAFRSGEARIQKGKAVIEWTAIPYGTYAVGMIHDENGNHKLDTNFIGKPTEGTGASNNARGTLGPPKWKDARFVFQADGQTLHITVGY